MTQEQSPTKFQPLYIQVKEHLTKLIVEGRWLPGAALPSENQLASELGVSQGTVRKALDDMTAEKLVVRRQGRGTFIAEHTQEQALFHFFRLADAEGVHPDPTSEVLSVEHSMPSDYELEALNLNDSETVTRIKRVRFLGGEKRVLEEIVVPSRLFPEIESHQPLPNTLYTLYQSRYGLSVLRAKERLRAISADDQAAQALSIKAGDPVLQIERVAFSIDGRPIELRFSLCLTDRYSYQVELT